MKVLIAPDKFKGSLSALEVCEAIDSGLKRYNPSCETVFHPMADGGDGSLAILVSHLSLQMREVETSDPLGRKIRASYFTSAEAAFIELAGASGLVLLSEEERDPMVTSTVGTGILVADAIRNGCQQIYLFLGGSATNDAGMGIAAALGWQFLDQHKKVLSPVGNNLSAVHHIQSDGLLDLKGVTITLLCDVSNPLYGMNGAAHVYARQKGANEKEVEQLDRGLVNFSQVIHQQFDVDISNLPGSGAAGGIGASLLPLCGAKIQSGFQTIAELTGLEKRLQSADRVITGEGKLDEQSLQGKVIDGVGRLCRKHQKPLTLFVGRNDLSDAAVRNLGADMVFSVMDQADDLSDAMVNGARYLEEMAFGFAKKKGWK